MAAGVTALLSNWTSCCKVGGGGLIPDPGSSPQIGDSDDKDCMIQVKCIKIPLPATTCIIHMH